MRHSERRWAVAAALTAASMALVACEPVEQAPEADAIGDASPSEMSCEIGQIGDGAAFVPASERDTAELQLGFQGFLFIALRVATLDPQAPPLARVSVSFEAEGDEPVGISLGQIAMTRAGELAVSSELVIILSPTIVSHFAGRTAVVTMRVEGSGRRCVTSATLRLVDDDPCIHTGEDPICPGDEGWPTDAGEVPP